MLNIISCIWNGEKYIKRCIDSIKSQQITEWKCYICNDCSTDNTHQIIIDNIKNDNRFVYINNIHKLYPIGNHWNVIQNMNNDDIALSLDGDDWFSDDKVLDRILQAYNDGITLVTYGQFKHYHREGVYSQGFAAPPSDWNNLRSVRYTMSHLRTIKVELFKKIYTHHLMYNGSFFPKSADVAYMFPALEMAGPNKSKFISEVNYIYNVENTLNEHKLDLKDQNFYADYIRSLPKYNRI